MEADHLEELGKEDLAILCKFIYQTPALPVMDPVSLRLITCVLHRVR